jgi:hypothetical protein
MEWHDKEGIKIWWRITNILHKKYSLGTNMRPTHILSISCAYRVGVKTKWIISDRGTDRKLTECKNEFGRIVTEYSHGYGYWLTDTKKDLVLLISDRIRRYTIFQGYIHTISNKISSSGLLSTWLEREDKRELYILSYGTQTPPRKARASFI